MDHLLQVVRLKGKATRPALTAALEVDPTDALAKLIAADLVEPTEYGYRLTGLGNDRVDETYRRERQQAGPVLDDVYASFVPINDEVKHIITDWQLRSVGGGLAVNDHSDPYRDERVIARLRHTDRNVPHILAPLTSRLPRFDLYPRRLRRALTLVSAGDHSMLAAPLKDSYHTVWFELHEDLMHLSGRERVREGAVT